MRTISPLTFFWGVLTVSAPIVWIFAWSKGVPDFSKLFFVGVIGSVVFYSWLLISYSFRGALSNWVHRHRNYVSGNLRFKYKLYTRGIVGTIQNSFPK